jgi:single-strand DNA-binding protein
MLQLTATGHIGQDAKIQEKNGDKFLTFSIAETLRVQVDKETGEQLRNEKTTWIKVTSNKLKLAEYLKKGTKVLIQGRLSVSHYKNDAGEWKIDVKVSNPNIEFLSGKKADQDEK